MLRFLDGRARLAIGWYLYAPAERQRVRNMPLGSDSKMAYILRHERSIAMGRAGTWDGTVALLCGEKVVKHAGCIYDILLWEVSNQRESRTD